MSRRTTQHLPAQEQPLTICERRGLKGSAIEILRRDRKASTSYLQRRLQIGYNRAATLIKKMEKAGIISEANAAGKRDILVDVVDQD